MDYYTNIPAERHLVGGALLFWKDFAPFAGRVHEEFFSDPELLYIWRAAARTGGDITAVSPMLYPKALELIEEYNGAAPDALITHLEEVAPRRRLQELAAEIIRALDAGDEVGAVVTHVKRRIATMDSIDD